MRNGSMYAVVTSGMSCMSDSWMLAKPRMDEPSNSWPTEKNSSSTVDAGMLKCCCTPGRSVNRISRNLTSVSLMNASTSDESLNMWCLQKGAGADETDGFSLSDPRGKGLPRHNRRVSAMLRGLSRASRRLLPVGPTRGSA